MDNKITKNRLSSFFSYEWLKIIIFVVLAVILFELLFTVTAQKLNKGQEFKIIYDERMQTEFKSDVIKTVCLENDKSIFSYEVQKMDTEVMLSDNDNVFAVRHKVQDVDVLITDTLDNEYVRAKTIVDNYNVWAFEDVVTSCEQYLMKFLKDDILVQGDDAVKSAVYNYDNLDESKIDANFDKLHKKDNRFRKEKDYQEGLRRERIRIKNIVSDMTDIKYLLENHPELFYRYTRYEQYVEKMDKNAEDFNQQTYNEFKAKLDQESEKSYAVKASALSGGKHNTADYFLCDGKTENVVLMCFDFTKQQPHLQYETLRFFTSAVRKFTNIFN